MLSEPDRRALARIERRLRAADPEFASTFEAGSARLGRTHPALCACVLVTALVLVAVTAVLSMPALTEACAGAAVAALLWHAVHAHRVRAVRREQGRE